MTSHPATPLVAETDPAVFSARDFRNAMGAFASGVVVITTRTAEGQAHAMTANAFMSGSLEPPLVVISVAVTARMHGLLTAGTGFGVSILAQGQQADSNHFAGRPQDGHAPRLTDLAGMPVLEDAVVRLTADTQHAYPCGDHTLFVGRVRALDITPPEAAVPLLYHRGKYGALAG